MKRTYITTNSRQTQQLGELLAGELQGGPARNASRSDAGGEIICLTGELGSGKTTFAQGVLKGLGAKGPYTSPTFVVLKHYRIMNYELGIRNVYHIDCYRIKAKDILDLGWEEIIAGKDNVVIVEWAERIKQIMPKEAIWLSFEHSKRGERQIKANLKLKNQSAK